MNEHFKELKWEVIKRMEDIERSLFWQGTLSRQELANKLRMSNPQTTTIIKKYLEYNPLKMTLNPSTKRYEVNDSIPNLFYQASFEDLIQFSDELEINTFVLQPPSRFQSLDILKSLTRVLRNDQSIEITYHSKSDPKGIVRRITPHSFVNNGKRTHVRAWCHYRKDFRDFIIGRISKAEHPDKAGNRIKDDEAWNTLLILKLVPNPALSPAAQKIVEMDYQMTNGVSEIKVRQSLLYYYFEFYNLWPEHKMKDPKLQEVVLGNTDIIRFL